MTTACSTESQNIVAEVKSKCYDTRPHDRYKIIYSYPSTEYGAIVSNVIGDTLFFSTGESGFLTQNNSQETEKVDINLSNGDVIEAELSQTSVLTVVYNPLAGAAVPVTVPGAHVEGAKTFTFSFANPTLNIVITETGEPTVTIDVNMVTHVITVS